MPIDTTVQPWIAKMLSPADPRLLGMAIHDFEKGFAGAYLATKAWQRNDIIAAGGVPDERGNVERFLSLAHPEEQRTIDETLSVNLSTIGKEIGGLKTSEDIFRWVARNSALAANPASGKMLETIFNTGKQMAQLEAESIGHITAKKLAQEKAELMVKYGLGADASQSQLATARASENEMVFTEHSARYLRKDISGLINAQDFDTNGNWLPGAQQRILKGAPAIQLQVQPTTNMRDSQFQSSLETVIENTPEGPERSILQRQLDTFKSRSAHSAVESEVGRRITEYEKRTNKKLPEDEVRRMYEIAGGLEPRAAVVQPPVSEADYIAKHIDKTMEQTVIVTDAATGRARLPRNRAEAADYLSSEYKKFYNKPAAAPSTTAPPPAADTVPVRSPDGKLGRIPRSQLEEALKQGYTVFEGGKG